MNNPVDSLSDGRARIRLRHVILGLLALLGNLSAASAADPRVTATIEPAEIALGQTALFTVTVEGGDRIGEPVPPTVDGLNIAFIRTFSSINYQFINGRLSGGTVNSFTFRVDSIKTGSFTIPSFEVVVDNKKIKTNPVTFQVLKGGTGTPQPVPQPGPAPPAASSTPPADEEEAEPPPSEAVFVRLSLPKRDYYAGELIRLELKIYVQKGSGIVLDKVGLPQVKDPFIVGKIKDKIVPGEEIDHGEACSVSTIHLTVTAVKTGELPLSLPIEVVLKVPSRSRSVFGRFFDDPFFDRAMGWEVKRFTLCTPETKVRVLPLPTEGQPAQFSGAVGRFEISSSASPTSVSVGDPITLRSTITGLGNFERVKAPSLESTDGWKVVNSRDEFKPTDDIGFSGSKTFEQAIIPQRADLQQVPPLRFVFFDPTARKYTTLTSPAVPVQVSAATGASSTAIPGGRPPSTGPSAPAAPSEELVPNKVELGHPGARLRPLILQPWFLGIQLAPLALVLLAWLIARRRQRLASDPALARALAANRAVRVQVEAMNGALRRQDAGAFFAAARRVLQERLGERFDLESQAITLSEVETLLDDSPLLAEIRRIFEIADSVAYSGQTFSTETLGEWRRVVLEAVGKLEKR